MQQQELLPHLFRTEFSKITAVLCKSFGIGHMEVAEDIASETFLSAMEIWTYKGLPDNPAAWLYTVAKNKAKNHLKRNLLFRDKIAPLVHEGQLNHPGFEIDLSEKNITDSQLQMLFAVCHPAVSTQAQVCLALRILCGFGINEIADAFITNKETINKRLFRAKEKLRAEQVPIEFPSGAEIDKRLDAVMLTLYLLYNEGYYSESSNLVLREDLCGEAMHLAGLLIRHPPTDKPSVNALYALMCFHSSRFAARKGSNGEIILYQDQDETLWNKAMIAEGVYYLHKAANGSNISRYHLEASIAYWHTIKADSAEKWENILQLYNRLLRIAYSPVAALNRTFALAKANGKHVAIAEAEKLQLTSNHYYYTLLGELYTGIDNSKASTNYELALTLAKTQADKQTISKKLGALAL